MSELCVDPLWYGEQAIATTKYLLKNKFKALNTLLKSAEREFLFPCL
jgi:hypothetical protein